MEEQEQARRRDAGMAYRPGEGCLREIAACSERLQRLNALPNWDYPALAEAAAALIPQSHGAVLVPPFYCEYGVHIRLGAQFFANTGCVFIDTGTIEIGDRCLLGPGVSIYTAGHPIHPETRRSGFEYARPVTVGDDVWIGGGAILLPGVRVGSGAVIGAGSVVSRDIPPMVVAAGNPCRVLRPITEADRRCLCGETPIDDAAWAEISGGEQP